MAERVLSGRYALGEIVGTGGMSIVYKAWDAERRREVAIKILRPEFAKDEEFVRRFTNEAYAASQMHHPNIVDIYGLGQDGDTRYIAMEFVEGVTLKEFIRQQGRIRPRRAIQMAIRILAAVDHAHRNHIVHRDIKPQNIIVDADYNVKVTDFGIARATNVETMTAGEAGNVLGSVHYFSPEQASGHLADEKSDLYSVGVVLYEMVTGRVPFDGDSPVTVALKHVRETPVPPSSVEPEVGKGLDEVIGRALEKDAANRYQSAAEMAADLKRAVRMPEGGFVRVAKKSDAALKSHSFLQGNGKWLLAAFLMLLAVFATLGFTLGRRLYREFYAKREAPALTSMYIEQAAALLDEMQIPYTIEAVRDGAAEAGVVTSQSPDSGQPLYDGDRMLLCVSAGETSVYMPDLLGLPLAKAVESLVGSGAVSYTVRYVSEGALDGTVVSQTPEPGVYAPRDTAFEIVVTGQTALMPNFVDMSLSDARILAEVSGFSVGDIEYAVDAGAPGRVIGQSVAADKRELLGAVINLRVSMLDEASAYTAKLEMYVDVPNGGALVRVSVEDEDGERGAYSEQLSGGENKLDLLLLSRYPGAHAVRVYMNGEQTYQKDVEFS